LSDGGETAAVATAADHCDRFGVISAAVIAVSWTMGSSQVADRVARLAERERVVGPVLQVAVEADRVCAFLGGGSGASENTTDDDLADTVSELNASDSSVYDDNQTTVLAAEHVLLLVKAVSADLSDAFSDRYDMGFLNITAPAGVGGAEGQPFSGSWLWVHRPYWPLVRQWFYGIFSFGECCSILCTCFYPIFSHCISNLSNAFQFVLRRVNAVCN
jgi:hypothetical protein